MKILNLGCGMNLLPPPFVNVDMGHQGVGLANFVDANLLKPLPFDNDSVNGIVANHVLEHLDAFQGKQLMKECYRVLVPGGMISISVPNVSYFRQVHHEDTKENSGRLFGEQMDEGNPNKSFFDCVVFMHDCDYDYHKQVMSEDTLWAHFVASGFKNFSLVPPHGEVADLLKQGLNRPIFSLIGWASKEV